MSNPWTHIPWINDDLGVSKSVSHSFHTRNASPIVKYTNGGESPSRSLLMGSIGQSNTNLQSSVSFSSIKNPIQSIRRRSGLLSYNDETPSRRVNCTRRRDNSESINRIEDPVLSTTDIPPLSLNVATNIESIPSIPPLPPPPHYQNNEEFSFLFQRPVEIQTAPDIHFSVPKKPLSQSNENDLTSFITSKIEFLIQKNQSRQEQEAIESHLLQKKKKEYENDQKRMALHHVTYILRHIIRKHINLQCEQFFSCHRLATKRASLLTILTIRLAAVLITLNRRHAMYSLARLRWQSIQSLQSKWKIKKIISVLTVVQEKWKISEEAWSFRTWRLSLANMRMIDMQNNMRTQTQKNEDSLLFFKVQSDEEKRKNLIQQELEARRQNQIRAATSIALGVSSIVRRKIWSALVNWREAVRTAGRQGVTVRTFALVLVKILDNYLNTEYRLRLASWRSFSQNKLKIDQAFDHACTLLARNCRGARLRCGWQGMVRMQNAYRTLETHRQLEETARLQNILFEYEDQLESTTLLERERRNNERRDAMHNLACVLLATLLGGITKRRQAETLLLLYSKSKLQSATSVANTLFKQKSKKIAAMMIGLLVRDRLQNSSLECALRKWETFSVSNGKLSRNVRDMLRSLCLCIRHISLRTAWSQLRSSTLKSIMESNRFAQKVAVSMQELLSAKNKVEEESGQILQEKKKIESNLVLVKDESAVLQQRILILESANQDLLSRLEASRIEIDTHDLMATEAANIREKETRRELDHVLESLQSEQNRLLHELSVLQGSLQEKRQVIMQADAACEEAELRLSHIESEKNSLEDLLSTSRAKQCVLMQQRSKAVQARKYDRLLFIVFNDWRRRTKVLSSWVNLIDKVKNQLFRWLRSRLVSAALLTRLRLQRHFQACNSLVKASKTIYLAIQRNSFSMWKRQNCITLATLKGTAKLRQVFALRPLFSILRDALKESNERGKALGKVMQIMRLATLRTTCRSFFDVYKDILIRSSDLQRRWLRINAILLRASLRKAVFEIKNFAREARVHSMQVREVESSLHSRAFATRWLLNTLARVTNNSMHAKFEHFYHATVTRSNRIAFWAEKKNQQFILVSRRLFFNAWHQHLLDSKRRKVILWIVIPLMEKRLKSAGFSCLRIFTQRIDRFNRFVASLNSKMRAIKFYNLQDAWKSLKELQKAAELQSKSYLSLETLKKTTGIRLLRIILTAWRFETVKRSKIKANSRALAACLSSYVKTRMQYSLSLWKSNLRTSALVLALGSLMRNQMSMLTSARDDFQERCTSEKRQIETVKNAFKCWREIVQRRKVGSRILISWISNQQRTGMNRALYRMDQLRTAARWDSILKLKRANDSVRIKFETSKVRIETGSLLLLLATRHAIKRQLLSALAFLGMTGQREALSQSVSMLLQERSRISHLRNSQGDAMSEAIQMNAALETAQAANQHLALRIADLETENNSLRTESKSLRDMSSQSANARVAAEEKWLAAQKEIDRCRRALTEGAGAAAGALRVREEELLAREAAAICEAANLRTELGDMINRMTRLDEHCRSHENERRRLEKSMHDMELQFESTLTRLRSELETEYHSMLNNQKEKQEQELIKTEREWRERLDNMEQTLRTTETALHANMSEEKVKREELENIWTSKLRESETHAEATVANIRAETSANLEHVIGEFRRQERSADDRWMARLQLEGEKAKIDSQSRLSDMQRLREEEVRKNEQSLRDLQLKLEDTQKKEFDKFEQERRTLWERIRVLENNETDARRLHNEQELRIRIENDETLKELKERNITEVFSLKKSFVEEREKLQLENLQLFQRSKESTDAELKKIQNDMNRKLEDRNSIFESHMADLTVQLNQKELKLLDAERRAMTLDADRKEAETSFAMVKGSHEETVTQLHAAMEALSLSQVKIELLTDQLDNLRHQVRGETQILTDQHPLPHSSAIQRTCAPFSQLDHEVASLSSSRVSVSVVASPPRGTRADRAASRVSTAPTRAPSIGRPLVRMQPYQSSVNKNVDIHLFKQSNHTNPEPYLRPRSPASVSGLAEAHHPMFEMPYQNLKMDQPYNSSLRTALYPQSLPSHPTSNVRMQPHSHSPIQETYGHLIEPRSHPVHQNISPHASHQTTNRSHALLAAASPASYLPPQSIIANMSPSRIIHATPIPRTINSNKQDRLDAIANRLRFVASVDSAVHPIDVMSGSPKVNHLV